MRNANVPLPHTYVVTDEGMVKQVKYGDGVSTCVYQPIVRQRGEKPKLGPPRVRQEWIEMGWSLLSDLYEKDEREDVRAHGFQHFLDYEKQVEARANGTYIEAQRQQRSDRSGQGDGKERRLFPANAFPDEWLPQEVLARRQGSSNVSRKKLVLPPPVAASKVAKGGSSKSARA